MGPKDYFTVETVKSLRKEVDALIQKVDGGESDDSERGNAFNYELYSQAHYQAHTKLIEAKMWLGKILEGLGNPFPKELADKAD